MSCISVYRCDGVAAGARSAERTGRRLRPAVRSSRLLGVTNGERCKYFIEFTQAIGELRSIEREVETKPISDARLIDSFTAEVDGTETVAF